MATEFLSTAAVVTADLQRAFPLPNVDLDIHDFAKTSVPVFIIGESGTGKEGLAKAIHNASVVQSGSHGKKPFIAVNCAAIPAELLEAELFGYRAGAFTGADRNHIGLLEQAHRGTIFLDEITAMPPEQQAKLLHIFSNGEFYPLGSNTPVKVNVRIIAATNIDPEKAVASGKLREDLYYRINVIDIHMKPLREMPDTIIPLAEFFLARLAAKNPAGRLVPFSEQAKAALLQHPWQGNIRELENTIERAYTLIQPVERKDENTREQVYTLTEPSPFIEPEHFDLRRIDVAVQTEEPEESLDDLCRNFSAQVLHKAPLPEILKRVRIQLKEEALDQNNDNVAAAAADLGIKAASLYRSDLERTDENCAEPKTKKLPAICLKEFEQQSLKTLARACLGHASYTSLVNDFESALIIESLKRNKTLRAAAESLGMSHRNLDRIIKTHNIDTKSLSIAGKILNAFFMEMAEYYLRQGSFESLSRAFKIALAQSAMEKTANNKSAAGRLLEVTYKTIHNQTLPLTPEQEPQALEQ